MFYQTEQGIESFPNFFTSCWTLWIMVRCKFIRAIYPTRLCGYNILFR